MHSYNQHKICSLLPKADVAGEGYRERAFLDAAGMVVEPVESPGGEVVVVEEVEAPPTVEVVVEQLVVVSGVDAVAVAAGQQHDTGDGDGAAEVDGGVYFFIEDRGLVAEWVTVVQVLDLFVDLSPDYFPFLVEKGDFGASRFLRQVDQPVTIRPGGVELAFQI